MCGLKFRQLVLAGVVSLGAETRLVAAPAMLVESGRPQAEIVIAGTPARMTRLAAEELQTYVEKISGATLPIVTQPSADATRIYVGISRFTDELGLETDGLKYGAFRMASGPDWLALLGPDKDFEPVEPWGRSRQRPERRRINDAWDEITGDTFTNPFHSLYMHYNEDLDIWSFDDRGTLHAVHAFLHDLGVRWYYPGPLGEIVPTRVDIALPVVDRVVRPDYPVRNISWWYQFIGESEEDARWRLRLGQHPGHDVMGITQSVHGMKYVHGRQEMREANPEFYAVWGGERAIGHKNVGAPCLSSEALFEKHVAYARAVFDHFNEPALSIDMVDGYGRGMCECVLCRGKGTPERGYQGSMSDYVWGYVNRVAEALYESHPDRTVLGLSYGAYTLPPESIERMSPNLALILMSPRRQLHDPVRWEAFEEEILQAWRERLPPGNLFTFENVMYSRGGGLWFFPRQLAAYLRRMQGVVSGERYGVYEHIPTTEYDWQALAVTHLDLYVASRLWWDVCLDVDAMLEEYYRLFYGPARAEMKAFIEHCEVHFPFPGREVEPIDRALELIAAAQAAVEPDTVYGRRVGILADYAKRLIPMREQLARPREGPDVPIPMRAASDVTLDGRLDDVFWKDVPVIELLDRESGEAPMAGTSVRMAWGDNDSLYIGIRCEEPDMEGLMDTADGGMAIFNGDNLDIVIETQIHEYYQLVVSPSGALFDLDRSSGFNSLWASGARVGVHHGTDYWSVEIQVPLAGEDARDLDPNHGVAGIRPRGEAPWYFNLGRLRPRPDKRALSVLAPTGDRHFHNRFIRARLWIENTDL